MADRSVPVRAVLFDAAGTLLHVCPSVGAIYAEEAGRFGVDASADTIDAAFRSAWRALRPYADGGSPFHTSEAVEHAWWRGLVERVFAEACGPAAFEDRFDPFFDALYLRFERPNAWRLFDDVAPALDALRDRRIPIAVVSNWDSRLPRLLDAIGIGGRFQFVLTSAEAGVSKPAPGIFHEAVARLGIAPEEALHVGDSMEDDVAGARRAGLRSMHLVRNDAMASRDGAIASLREVLPIVDAQ